jgi:hypothetical protein
MLSRARRFGLTAALLVGCASSSSLRVSPPPADDSALAYYPLEAGWGWAYEVERDGLAILALYAVAERRPELAIVRNGDERIEYAILPDGIARREGGRPADYLLRSPVRAGDFWPVASGTATVVEIGKTVTLPSGSYHDCALVEEVRRAPDRVTRTTYCRGVGPVEMEMVVSNLVTLTYERLAHARLMTVSRPETTGDLIEVACRPTAPRQDRPCLVAPTLALSSLRCGDGGTGRRARLRIWFRKKWGFESPFPHCHLIGSSWAAARHEDWVSLTGRRAP